MTVGRRGLCPNPNIPLAGRQLKRNSCLFQACNGVSKHHKNQAVDHRYGLLLFFLIVLTDI